MASTEPTGAKLEHVLHALDFEIENILSQEKRPGWTMWALIGSLAAVSWLFLDELETTIFNPHSVLPLVLILHLIYDSGIFTTRILSLDHNVDRLWKFRFSHHDLGDSRLGLLFVLIRQATLVFIATYSMGPVWLPFGYFVCIFYGVIGLFFLLFFILSFLRLPLPTYQKNIPLKGYIISILIIAGIVLSTVGYFIGNYSLHGPFSISEYRISILIFAIVYIFSMLLKKHNRSPMLFSLIRVRRDLAFNKIDTQVAIQQANIALTGMDVSQILQDEIQKMLGYLDEIVAENKEIVTKLKMAREEISIPSDELTKNNWTITKALLESISHHFEIMSNRRKKYDSIDQVLTKRIKWIIFIDPDVMPALINVRDKLGLAFQTLESEVDEATKENENLKERLDKIYLDLDDTTKK